MSLSRLTRFSFPAAVSSMCRRLSPEQVLGWRRQRSNLPLPGVAECGDIESGTTAPDFTLSRVGGRQCSLSDYRGRRVLLVFVRLRCQACRDIVPKLKRLQRHGNLQVLAIHRGRPHEAALWADDVAAGFPVQVQSDLDDSTELQVFAKRFAFVIDEQGQIAWSGIVSRRRNVEFVLDATEKRQSPGQFADSEVAANDVRERILEAVEADVWISPRLYSIR